MVIFLTKPCPSPAARLPGQTPIRRGSRARLPRPTHKRPGTPEQPKHRRHMVLVAAGPLAGPPSADLEQKKSRGEAQPGQRSERRHPPQHPARRASLSGLPLCPRSSGNEGPPWTAPSRTALHAPAPAPAPKAPGRPPRARGAERAARASPRSLRGRTGEGRHLRPSSAAWLALPPSALTRSAVAARASGPRPAAFPVRAAIQPAENGSGGRNDPRRTRARGPSSGGPCRDRSLLDVTNSYRFERAVCHQDHFSESEEADVP